MVLTHSGLNIFERLDRSLALRVTLHHIFEPLYQDRSVIGYVLGFIFRIIRVIVAFLVYGVIAIIFIAAYIIWAAYPLYLIYCAFTNHGTAKYLL